jgi:putative transposase
MANTYTQLNIHAIYAVKGRENTISESFRDNLHRYTAGILKESGAFPLAVGGWKDHIHIFYELPATRALSDIMGIVKRNSSKWINENKYLPGKFHWQEGYAAFSYARSQRDRVIKYIMTQEAHHRGISFRDEYLRFLKKFGIPYDERYVFEFYD